MVISVRCKRAAKRPRECKRSRKLPRVAKVTEDDDDNDGDDGGTEELRDAQKVCLMQKRTSKSTKLQ